MIESLSFEFSNRLEEKLARGELCEFRVMAEDMDGDTIFEHSFLCNPSPEFIGEPIYSTERILKEEPFRLFKSMPTSASENQIIALVSSPEGLALDIYCPGGSSSEYLDQPYPVTGETVVLALLESGTEYLDKFQRSRPESACATTWLTAGINDGERRLKHHQEHGTQDGYEPTIDRELLRTFASECVSHDGLRNFVLATTELKPFVQDLTTLNDDNLVTDCYSNLLGHFDEVIRPTAEALINNPDERARQSLQAVIWSEFEEETLVTAVKALQRIPTPTVVEQMATLLELHISDHIELCQTIAEWLQTIDPAEYLDHDELSRFESEVQSALEQTEHRELKVALRTVLADLSEG